MIQNDKFLNNVVDAKKAQDMLKTSDDKKLTLEESNEYAKYLGFDTYKELHQYTYRQQQRVLTLDKKYKLLSLSSDDLNYIVTEGMVRLDLPSSDEKYTTYKNCYQRYKNCKFKAGCTYTLGSIGCLGGGALVEGFSAGTLSGPVVWGVRLCLGAVAGIYYTDLNQCFYDWEDCTGN